MQLPAPTRRPYRVVLLATLSILCLAAAPIPLAGEAPQSLAAAFRELDARIKKVELPNGLRLVMFRSDYAPVAAAYLKFKAGSADETDASSGIAHMLEHMLFKGTPRVGTRDYERERKYLEQIVVYADRLDDWRRRARDAEARGDAAALAAARREIAKQRERLAQVTQMARAFIISEEDSQLYARHGSRGYNAYTTADLTNYQIELPANRLEVWARLESDRMVNSVLRDFYVERNVVTEERRMRVENDARRALLEKFLIEAYGAHPYGRPVIGPMESIQFLNYNQAMEFYRTYYAPNNAVIALAGDIDFAESEALVRKYFGDMRPRVIPPRPAEPPVERRALNVELKKEGSPAILFAWFKPAAPDPDNLYLEVLSEVLTDGIDSRLFQRLVARDKLAVNVSIWTDYPGERYTNLFIVNVIPAPGADYEKIQAALLDELDVLARDGVRPEELEKVRSGLRAAFLYRLRSNADLADTLSYYEILTGDYRNLFKYYSLVDTLTPDDVRAAAARHLKREWLMSARLLPPDSAPEGDAERPETEGGEDE